LIEVLVCIGIIGVLIALLLPAVQAAREQARRRQCGNNLSQLALAIANYESCHGCLPPGTIDGSGPIQSRAAGYHIGWIARILPFIEANNAFRHLDFSVGAYHPNNARVRRQYLAILYCPSDWSGGPIVSYAGCHHDVEAPINADNHGVLFLNSRVRYRDIRDGRAQTIFLGEKRVNGSELGWLSGTRATLRNAGTPINETSAPGGPLAAMQITGVSRGGMAPGAEPLPERSTLPGSKATMPWVYADDVTFDDQTEYQPAAAGGTVPALVVGGFESSHGGDGAQFAFGDGSVRFLPRSIDMTLYQRLAHRADGELTDDR
jgi:prepilin-type processing-associated H-X9-DG protein